MNHFDNDFFVNKILRKNNLIYEPFSLNERKVKKIIESTEFYSPNNIRHRMNSLQTVTQKISVVSNDSPNKHSSHTYTICLELVIQTKIWLSLLFTCNNSYMLVCICHVWHHANTYIYSNIRHTIVTHVLNCQFWG